MKENKTKYETGATSHAVNDLILFTDNTRELAELRDEYYKDFAETNSHPDYTNFVTLCHVSISRYKDEFVESGHITGMNEEQIKEYCQLYAEDFDNWKSEHGYK